MTNRRAGHLAKKAGGFLTGAAFGYFLVWAILILYALTRASS